VIGGSVVAGFAAGFTLIFESPSRVESAWDVVTGFGGVVVAVIAAMVTPIGSTFIHAVIQGVCTAVDTIPKITITCTGL
jgi:hypothetical protein